MRPVLALCLLMGCGVSQEIHDGVLQERDALKAQVQQLTQERDKARTDLAYAQKQVEKAAAVPTRPPEAQIAATRSQLKLAAGQELLAVLETSMGDVRCKLWPDIAPETVLNFVGLAEGTKEWQNPAKGGETTKAPLYDGTKFHRVIKGFMIQGGDPLGNGTGGPGYQFGDEVWPDVRFDRPGLLAMANAGKGTNGSQFFITAGTPAHLNMRHTIFGECETENVLKIAEVPVGGPQKSTPEKDVIVKKVRIERPAAATP